MKKSYEYYLILIFISFCVKTNLVGMPKYITMENLFLGQQIQTILANKQSIPNIVNLLLNNDFLKYKDDETNNTVLHLSIDKDRLDIFEYILNFLSQKRTARKERKHYQKIRKQLLTTKNSEGQTPKQLLEKKLKDETNQEKQADLCRLIALC